MSRPNGIARAIERLAFRLIHSMNRRAERNRRTLRVRRGRQVLLIDIRGQMAFGLIDGECIVDARDPSEVMCRLIEAARSSSPQPESDRNGRTEGRG